jgi:hypothetical protein
MFEQLKMYEFRRCAVKGKGGKRMKRILTVMMSDEWRKTEKAWPMCYDTFAWCTESCA